MKAITYSSYGTPAQLELVEAPEPKVGPGEVLIRVKAAGVNPVDWKLAAGYLDPILEVRYPVIPGWDVAGVVEAVGPDTFDFAVGDEVYGYVRKEWVELGTYAELVSAPVRTLARKPRTLTFEQAAGVPLAGLTAYQSLTRVDVKAGETVVIHSAAGGTGSFGVQIAVALGLRVIGTAGAHNHDYLRSLGAEPVLYGDGLADRIRELAPEGIDAGLDFFGEGAVDILQTLVKERGRVVSIADYEAAAKGAHQIWVRPDTADLTFLAELADRGGLTVNVEHALPLAEAAKAWELSAAGRTRGKIVLTV
ncbi:MULTISPECIES: NADP-dependent oxidoreductase [Streptomyces]|uniref:NADP-dependent oxidoreductase n=1 Tax=Streptomyces TaxID=1883 RepID=UPI000F78819E|nr:MULTISPECIES: NADP-dependent oxidoreductase [Streptomyces]RST05812.1 NADP-dependent oxidoreductase [Streptomyces sp. WAC07149]GLX21321.1 oxidoreductase [Streptomyces lavendulae subsp. lavendulae]GLX27839.1 oxidoreductase [Streptomyces lavendulae subsp. lavendulae]